MKLKHRVLSLQNIKHITSQCCDSMLIDVTLGYSHIAVLKKIYGVVVFFVCLFFKPQWPVSFTGLIFIRVTSNISHLFRNIIALHGLSFSFFSESKKKKQQQDMQCDEVEGHKRGMARWGGMSDLIALKITIIRRFEKLLPRAAAARSHFKVLRHHPPSLKCPMFS